MTRRHFSARPDAALASVSANAGLIYQMTRRQVIGRYRGSVMGLAWSLFYPLLMLTVYTFVFSVVFNARWNVDTGESRTQFAVVLFAGLIVHQLFAECLNRSPWLIVSNVNYVKKVIFPLEILPVVTVGAALFHALVSVGVLLAAYLVLNAHINATVLYLPVVLAPFLLFSLGVTWFLSALGVFVRDVSQVVGILATALLFLSPVFYPVSALPEGFQSIIMLNPLTFVIEQVRLVVIFGEAPSWSGLGMYTIMAVVVAALGFGWFQKTRRGFADVV